MERVVQESVMGRLYARLGGDADRSDRILLADVPLSF